MSKSKKSEIEARKKEKLLQKQIKAQQKLEQKELKVKLKEFNKKYFSYSQIDENISVEAKEELTRLGSFTPFYSGTENDRSILIMKMWQSNNQEVKDMVIKEAQIHFLITEHEKIEEFLTQIYQTNVTVEQRMKKMKEAREEARFKNWG